MAYTPELSQKHSGTLRRIAWSMDIPMTEAIEHVFDYVGQAADSKIVCEACRDRTFCDRCVFNHDGKRKESTCKRGRSIHSGRLLSF